MIRAAAVSLLLGAGCLSTPDMAPSDDDDDTPIDARADAPPDGGGVGCNAVGDFTDAAYPPGGLVLRQVRAADVNGDGVQDLLVVDNQDGAEAVHVLLGPVALANPRLHATVPTQMEVGEVDVRQVDGEACLDLTMFGRTRGGTATGLVQVRRYDGAGGAMFSAPLTREVDFAPVVTDVPTMVTWAHVHAGSDDILVADLDDMRIVHVHQGVESLSSAPYATVHHDSPPTVINFLNTNGIEPRRHSDGLDRVLVVELGEAHLLVDSNGDGTGTFGSAPSVETDSYAYTVARGDLDGAAPDDAIFGGGTTFGAFLLDENGATFDVTEVNGPHDYPVYGDDFVLTAATVGSLGGGAAPDWVAVDSPSGGTTGPARAVLVEDLMVNGAALDGNTPQVFDGFPGGFVPRSVVIADLRGAGTNQAWVVAEDGALVCLERDELVSALQLCD